MIRQLIICFSLISTQVMALIPDSGQVVVIPVVVHVVYNTANQNISESQIKSQIGVLNKDYRRLNSDAVNTPEVFKSVAADCDIEFQLANYTSDGYETNGITRTSTSKTQFFNDDITSTSKGGKDSWGTNYLNVWVTNLPDGTSGWSNGLDSDSSKQGIVIDYEYFGNEGTAKSPYNLGRTVTHEIGHWLGLVHLEGVGSNCDVDDGIEDTPNQASSISGDVSSNTSCGSADMTSNFMQYVNDSQMNLFTEGQKTVMRNTLFNDLQLLLQNVTNTVGVEDELEGIEFTVFPNPIVDKKFTLHNAIAIDSDVYLYDLKGKLLQNSVNRISDTEFTLKQSIQSGVYFLKWFSKGQAYQSKINIVD